MADETPAVVPDRGPMIRGVNIFLISLSIVAVTIRFISRKLTKAGLWWDDWLCLCALPVVIVVNVLPIIATIHGLGKHIQDAAWDAFEYVQLLFFLDLLLGPLAITLVKASVICFYRRTFRSTNKSFPIFIWTLLGVVVAWFLAMFIVTIFTCKPIAAQWNPVVHGSCLDAQQFFLGQTTSNAILDFVILFTPVPFLYRLHITRSKKIGLFIVFILGYLVPVIAIMRIISTNAVFTLAWAHELDPSINIDLTWNYVDAEIWTFAEPAAGVISCSIPACSYVFSRALKRIRIGSTRKSSQGQKRSYGYGHHSSRKTPLDGSFARLRENDEGFRNDHPKNNTAISAGSETADSSRNDQTIQLQQIHITDDVDVRYEATETV